jgi:transcriptional regulator with XRE-family HTH domain
MVTMLRHFPPETRKTWQGETLGANLRLLRLEKNLTLEALAQLSGVSRAMISKIERGNSMPTAMVLGKLSKALNVGLSRLVGGYSDREPTLLSPFEQPVFRDPESGLERRSLSPLFPDRMVDFVLNTLPPNASVAFPPHQAGIEEYLYVSRGRIAVIVGDKRFEVPAGSSLFYPGNVRHEFHNISKQTAEFFIVIDDNGAR